MDLNQFRNLLNLYFDGATDQEQEKMLSRMVEDVDMDSLPDDLKADVALIRDITSLSKDADSFAASLDNITAENPSRRKAPRRFRIAPRIISVASAAAVIAAGVYFIRPSDSSVADVSKPLSRPIAEAKISDNRLNADVSVYHQTQTSPLPETSATDNAYSDNSVVMKHTSVKPQKPLVVSATNDRDVATVEITDPQEAEIVVTESLNLLFANLDIPRKSIEQSQSLLQTSFRRTMSVLDDTSL